MAVVHNPTRFPDNYWKTFQTIMQMDRQTNKQTNRSQWKNITSSMEAINCR